MIKLILLLGMLSFGAKATLLDCGSRIIHLASREGFRADMYKDTKGHLTIGYGHKVLDTELPLYSKGISKLVAVNLLLQDARIHDKLARTIYKGWKLNCNQKNAINDMVFQLGYRKTMKFKNTLKAIKNGKYKKAASLVKRSLWFKQTPVRVKDFMKRIQHAND